MENKKLFENLEGYEYFKSQLDNIDVYKRQIYSKIKSSASCG